MKRWTGFVVLLASLAAFIACEEGTPTDGTSGPPIGPCQDYACDSLTVRYILDVNGLDTVAVEDVTQTGFMGPRVERLELSNAGLTVVPPAIENLVALQVLRLDRNNLTSLPPEVGNLVSLWVLEVHYNSLTTLPPEMGNLDSLRFLVLDHNKLTSLPLSITGLILGNVDVCNNRLTNVTPEVATWLDLYAEPNWDTCQTPAP